MAAGLSEAASASKKFSVGDLADLSAALHTVSTKYRCFGLQIGLKMHEICIIESNHNKPADHLLDILFARLKLEPALTCADIVMALKSTSVSEHSLAIEFQKQFESKGLKEPSKKNEVEKVPQSHAPLRMSEEESERDIVASESKSDESENIQKTEKSAELEGQVHERDEPKSKNANEITCGKAKNTRMEYSGEHVKKAKHKEKLIPSEMAAGPQSGAEPDQKNNKSVKESEKSQHEATTRESDIASSFACKEKAVKSEKMGKARDHSELKPHKSESVSNRQVRNEARKKREVTEKEESTIKFQRKAAMQQTSDKSQQTDSENEESDSGNDSEGKYSDEKYYTASSDFEEEDTTPLKRKEAKKDDRKLKKKRVNKSAVESSKYESCTRKVKGKRESEAASLKYDSPGDDEQSDPGHGSRDQEEHDIPQKRRKKKKQRRDSSMTPTAIGSSSPSTSQEEKKKQPVSKKERHRKKHVRKMKERMKKEKEKAARSSGTDDSSPECGMTKNQYEGEMKELVNIFERFFGQLCCVAFDPKDIAAKLQKKGLISRAMMREMMLSPESQQAKIIALVDGLDEIIKSCPDHLFATIEVMLENEALQETAREILRETSRQGLIYSLHFILGSKTLSQQVECVLLKLLPNFALKYLPLTLQSHQLLILFHQLLNVCYKIHPSTLVS